MTIRVRVQGKESLQKQMARIPVEVRDGVEGALALSAFQLKGDIQRNLDRGTRSGRIYTHRLWTDSQGRLRLGRKRNKPHQASAPGEFPKTDNGDLVRSIFANIEGLIAEVGTDVKHGAYLEFGTRKMAPRPWLIPTFESLKPRISKRIQAAIRKANRRAAR